MAKILIVDDEEVFCEMLSRILRGLGHDVSYSHTLSSGLEAVSKAHFDIVCLDVRLPDGNGLEAIPRFRAVLSHPEIVIMTGAGDPDGAELAIKNGAWDYIEKPSSLSTMLLPMVRALQYRDAKTECRSVRSLKRDGIVGNSRQMQACLEVVSQAAVSDANVLISGETGTGKEVIAWAIHNNSSRAGKSFVVVDCASLTESLVESVLFGHERGSYTGAERAREGLVRQAHGGTLFLDEVGELTFSIQKSFLRVLQERRFRPLGSKVELESDFRLVAATNRDLGRMVDDGRFREDLYYRLQSFNIELPSLQERPEDIAELTFHYIMKISRRCNLEPKGISPELLQILRSYEWPGNVRELVQTVERMIAAAPGDSILVPKHLPLHIRIAAARASVAVRDPSGTEQGGTNENEAAQSVRPAEIPPGLSAAGTLPPWQDYRNDILNREECAYLRQLLAVTGGDIKKACRVSRLSRSRLYELFKKHALSVKD